MFPVIGLGIFVIVMYYTRNGSLCKWHKIYIKDEACLLRTIKGRYLAKDEKCAGFTTETDNLIVISLSRSIIVYWFS